MLERPIVDTKKVMITNGMKEVVRHMDWDESKLIELQKQTEILRGYLQEFLGPIDLEEIETTLVETLQRKGMGK